MAEQLDQALAVIDDDPQASDLRLLLLMNKIGMLPDLDRPGRGAGRGPRGAHPRRAGRHPVAQEIRVHLALRYFEAGQWDDAIAEVEQADSGGRAPEHQHLVGVRCWR